MTWFSFFAWSWVLGFWCGYGWRAWGQRNAARIPSPREKLGDGVIEAIGELEHSHRFVTPDIVITYHGKVTSNGREYAIAIKRWEHVDA